MLPYIYILPYINTYLAYIRIRHGLLVFTTFVKVSQSLRGHGLEKTRRRMRKQEKTEDSARMATDEHTFILVLIIYDSI